MSLKKELMLGRLPSKGTRKYTNTSQPLYNTIVGVQANFRVSYPILVRMRVKCSKNSPK